jgi:hypothetical protein
MTEVLLEEKVVMNATESARHVLAENAAVIHGIFGVIESSGVFPPREFLNAFLMLGYDPCDQDARMTPWRPFELTHQDYLDVKAWWLSTHPASVEDDLGATSWNEWTVAIIHR